MSALKFIASACMVLWFGWLFFQPAYNEPEHRTMDKIGQKVEKIYDRAVELYDQDHRDGQVCTSNSDPNTPDRSLEKSTQKAPLGSDSETRISSSKSSGNKGFDETIETTQPERPLDDISFESFAATAGEEPTGYESNDPTMNTKAPPGLDEEPVSPSANHESDLASDQDHQTILTQKTPSKPSEDEIDRYLERFHTAGTHATENLERVSRLLGR
jgi:hypothetical protein